MCFQVVRFQSHKRVGPNFGLWHAKAPPLHLDQQRCPDDLSPTIPCVAVDPHRVTASRTHKKSSFFVKTHLPKSQKSHCACLKIRRFKDWLVSFHTDKNHFPWGSRRPSGVIGTISPSALLKWKVDATNKLMQRVIPLNSSSTSMPSFTQACKR